MRILFILVAIFISLAATASIEVSVSCFVNRICDDSGNCRSEKSYGIGSYLENQGFRFNTEEGVRILVNMTAVEIVIINNNFS